MDWAGDGLGKREIASSGLKFSDGGLGLESEERGDEFEDVPLSSCGRDKDVSAVTFAKSRAHLRTASLSWIFTGCGVCRRKEGLSAKLYPEVLEP